MCKKDFYLEKHSDDIPIANLEVMTLLKSFKSKGFVKETFNWRYHYFYLTNEGIEYLRQYLALPADIVPATLKVTAQKTRSGEEQAEGGRGKKFAGDDFKPKFQRTSNDEYRK